jgi:hypothetical protein
MFVGARHGSDGLASPAPPGINSENAMATILVAYDLRTPGKDYSALIARIKTIGSGWCTPLESTWIIQIAATPQAVRDDLLVYADGNDKFLVLDISGDTMAWCGMPADVSTWLQATP